MLRSMLRSKILKNKIEKSKQLNSNQWNLRVTLLRKSNRNYFVYLDSRILKDNGQFWKTVNPLYSEIA